MLRFKTFTALAAAAASVACLALPAAAGASRPVRGTFFNGSSSNGMFFSTNRYSIPDLQFYCKGDRYDIQELVYIHRNGRFSYSGRAQKYGHSAEPFGAFKVRLSGRFTSPTRVTIKRRLSACNTATVRAKGKRASST
jgi:hypothetical protein